MAKTMWRRLTPGQTEHSCEGTGLEEVEAGLVRRGVSPETARRAASRIERQLRGLPSETVGFVLDGAALALAAGSDLPGIASEEIREGLVVRRLVSDFARELQGRAEDRERIEALEKAVGAKAVGRQKRKRREW